jgi:cytochrome c
MAEFAGDWTPEALNEFLTSPSDYIDGTKMSYRGMADIEDRANLIAYLEGAGG